MDREYSALHSMHLAAMYLKAENGYSEALSSFATDDEAQQYFRPVCEIKVDSSIFDTKESDLRLVQNFHSPEYGFLRKDVGSDSARGRISSGQRDYHHNSLTAASTHLHFGSMRTASSGQIQQPSSESSVVDPIIDITAGRPSVDPLIWPAKIKLQNIVEAMDRNLSKRKMAKKHFIAGLATLIPMVVRAKACLVMYPFAPSDDDIKQAIMYQSDSA